MLTHASRSQVTTRFTLGCALAFSIGLVLFTTPTLSNVTAPSSSASAHPPALTKDLPTDLVHAIKRDLGMTPDRYLEQAELGQQLSRFAQELQTEFPTSFGSAWIDATGNPAIGVLPGATSEAFRHKILSSEFSLMDVSIHENSNAPNGFEVNLHTQAQQIDDADPIDNKAMGGDAYISQAHGLALRCSLGFNATDSRGNPVNISAGHCNPNAEEAGTPVNFTSDHLLGAEFGVFTKSHIDGSDYSIISINKTSAPLFATSEIRGSDSFIDGTAKPIVGAVVCKSGATTGFTCGTITAVNQNLFVNDDRPLNGVFATDICALHGDSGGALISGTKALGIVSASTVSEFDSCEVASFINAVKGTEIQLFATPISAILADNPGLYLRH